jgi:hypothetical protein
MCLVLLVTFSCSGNGTIDKHLHFEPLDVTLVLPWFLPSPWLQYAEGQENPGLWGLRGHIENVILESAIVHLLLGSFSVWLWEIFLETWSEPVSLGFPMSFWIIAL